MQIPMLALPAVSWAMRTVRCRRQSEKERLHRKSVRREQPRFLSGTIETGADFVIIAEADAAVDTVPVLKEGKVCGIGQMEILKKRKYEMSNSLYNRAEVNET